MGNAQGLDERLGSLRMCRVQVSWPFPASLLPDAITGAEEDNDSKIPGQRARVQGGLHAGGVVESMVDAKGFHVVK
jgi:hypothetical protein